MKNDDYVISALALDDKVRVFIAITTNTCGHATKVHNLMPVPTAALGRTLTAGVLMSCLLKNDSDSLTIQIKGDGPIGRIVVCSDNKSNVRGYVDNPYVDLPVRKDGKLDVSGGVGKGILNVIRDVGLKEPYGGYVELVSGEIAEDLAYYFTVSEQTNSAISLGVLVNTDGSVLNSGGFIIQLLPGYTEETVNFLEQRLATLPSFTSLLSEGLNCEMILDRIFEGTDVNILAKRPCQFNCNCSREKMERNLISLGVKDLTDIANDESVELVCHFCNTKYVFTQDEIKQLLKEIV